MPFVDERVGRHDLDRGDAERGQMRDRCGMRESREGCARAFRDRRVEARKAAQVELIDDERLRRDALAARLALGRRARDGLRREGTAVVAEREHRRMEAKRPVEAPGVRVGQQFGGVEAGPARRVIRSLDAEAVARACPEAGRKAAQDAARVTGHRRAKNLAVAVVQAEGRALGVRQVERGFEASRRYDDAESGLRAAHSAGLAMAR